MVATPMDSPLEPALGLMEILVITATTMNGLFGVRVRADDPKNAVKAEMIAGLHEKGCTTATEVLALLRGKLADGALARWRSLYEIELITSFIASQDPSTAERYLGHAAIKNWEAINSLSTFVTVDSKIVAGFRQKRDEAVQKYGTKFKREYGWAADVVGTAKQNGPNRRDLEKAIGKEKWSPLYRAASYQVHPLASAVVGFMTTGVQGMALPGIATADSLKTLSHVFIDVCMPERKRPSAKELIDKKADEAGEAFSLLP